jgi:hypothetical protein
MSKKYTFPLTFILLAILTSGCLRLATSPTVDLTQFTPQASVSPPAGMTSPEALAPTTTPALDAASQNTLRLFPLWVGSTWVYDYLGYTPEQEVHWRLTETVISSAVIDGNYVVEVERQSELTLGDPSPDFPFQPPSGTVYYIIDGEQIFQNEEQIPTDLAEATLELVLPFPPEGEYWYPNPADRAASEPPEIGGRTADGPYEQAVSESGTRICYNVKTEVDKGVQEMAFCEGIGIVFSEAKSFEGEGYRKEMIGFVLQ